jgi:hypothetical protein
MNDDIQTRATPGAQLRRQARHHDETSIIRDAHLEPVQRSFTLEHLETAHTADTRSELGGARYLQRVADQTPATLGPLRRTLQRLATVHVHPDIRP